MHLSCKPKMRFKDCEREKTNILEEDILEKYGEETAADLVQQKNTVCDRIFEMVSRNHKTLKRDAKKCGSAYFSRVGLKSYKRSHVERKLIWLLSHIAYEHAINLARFTNYLEG